jgi:hypothetical protein
MLGLADQVGSHHRGVCCLVGDHGTLGRTRNHIDAHTAEQHALGLGHEAVTRADDDVGLVATEDAIGQ